MRSSGNGSSVENVVRANAVTGPISTKRVSRTTLAGRRRVSGQAACECRRCAGWASCEREALAEEQEAVEEAARQLHVVVDDQQPVAVLRRVLGEQPVEVLELAQPLRGDTCAARRRGASAAARARIALRERAVLGALDAEHEHPLQRRRRRRAASSSRRRWPLRQLQRVAGRVERPRGAARPGRRRCRSRPTGSRRGLVRRAQPAQPRAGAAARAGPRAGARRCGRPSSARPGSGGGARARRSRRACAARARSDGARPSRASKRRAARPRA